MRVAGASRSLELAARTSTQSSTEAPASGQAVPRRMSVAPTSSSPLRKPSAANTSLVATGTRGLTITHGMIGSESGNSVSPTPVMSQGRERRHTGAPAADAGCDRQQLVEGETADLQIRHALPKQARGLEHEVVGCFATGAGQRSRQSELKFGAGR